MTLITRRLAASVLVGLATMSTCIAGDTTCVAQKIDGSLEPAYYLDIDHPNVPAKVRDLAVTKANQLAACVLVAYTVDWEEASKVEPQDPKDYQVDWPVWLAPVCSGSSQPVAASGNVYPRQTDMYVEGACPHPLEGQLPVSHKISDTPRVEPRWIVYA